MRSTTWSCRPLSVSVMEAMWGNLLLGQGMLGVLHTMSSIAVYVKRDLRHRSERQNQDRSSTRKPAVEDRRRPSQPKRARTDHPQSAVLVGPRELEAARPGRKFPA